MVYNNDNRKMCAFYKDKAGDILYQNMVFDIGGVVVNYNPKEFLVDKFFHERTENKIYDAVFGSEEWQLLDKGELSWRKATEIFMRRGQEKDIAFEMLSVLEEWTQMLTTKNATVTLLRLLKKRGFKLYYLTNMSKEVLGMLSTRDFWQLFEGGVASCEVGLLKPDIAIYRHLLQEYNLRAQQTIFTDDMQENTLASFEAGITGIQFKNVKSFCKMLVTYGIDIQA